MQADSSISAVSFKRLGNSESLAPSELSDGSQLRGRSHELFCIDALQVTKIAAADIAAARFVSCLCVLGTDRRDAFKLLMAPREESNRRTVLLVERAELRIKSARI